MTGEQAMDSYSTPWGALSDFLSYLGEALKRDGLALFLSKSAKKISMTLRGLYGAKHVQKTLHLDFDFRFGTDTADSIPTWKLRDVVSSNRRFASNYVPSQEKDVLMLFRLFPANPAEYMFIDIGSGKGKVLLLAAEFGFKKIVGVEFSPSLHAIAQSNVEKYLARSSRNCSIECICQDAAEYPIPPENLVIFLYNPFHEVVIQTILQRLHQSLKDHQRQVFIINFGSLLRRALCESRFLQPIAGEAGRWIHSNKLVPTEGQGRTPK
jgi:SAM-dependent methyltransferase